MTDIAPIADFAEQLHKEAPTDTGWNLYENEQFAMVFEFPEHRRLQTWDEADFMGSLDGYSYVEQLWSGEEWVDIGKLSTETHPPLTPEQFRSRVAGFRAEAEATNPANLTPAEASFDRIARHMVGENAKLRHQVNDLQGKLSTVSAALDQAVTQATEVRAAVVAIGKRLSRPAQPSPAHETGPVIDVPTAAESPSRH